MNPELLNTEGALGFIVLLAGLGGLSFGFVMGWLAKNFSIHKKLHTLENTLEKYTGQNLDEFFNEFRE